MFPPQITVSLEEIAPMFFVIAMLVPLYVTVMLFIHPRPELETLSFTESVRNVFLMKAHFVLKSYDLVLYSN